MAREWYCEVAGQLLGPFEPADLKRMAKSGDLNPADRIRQGSSGKWVEARKAKGLFDRPASPAEPTPVAPLSPTGDGASPATPDDDAIASWLGTPPASTATEAPAPAGPAADWSSIDYEEGDSFDKSAFPSHKTVYATPPDQRRKPCPFCGEEILEVAKKCKHCGELLDLALRPSAVVPSPSSSLPTKKPMALGSTRFNGVVGCATLFALLVCCGGIGQMISPNGGRQPAEVPSQPAPESTAGNQAPPQAAPSPARSQAAIESEERFEAIEAAKTFVKRRLNHPSTASFPWFGDDGKRASDGSWVVTGKVTAKNSFNLEVTMNYIVQVRHVGTQWSLIDIGMEESRE